MKRLLALCALLLFCCLPAASAQAHFLESDNGVHGMLHVTPSDNPVADHNAQLIFYMSAEGQTFSVRDCGCSLAVSFHGMPLETSKLRAGNGVLTASFLPPEAGAYIVTLAGNKFKLTYTIHVEAKSRGVQLTNAGTPALIMSIASFVILGIVAHGNIKAGKRYATKPEGKVHEKNNK